MTKYIWMAVTPDEYELPLAVADSARELSYILGVTIDTIKTSALRQSDGSLSGRKIVKVIFWEE